MSWFHGFTSPRQIRPQCIPKFGKQWYPSFRAEDPRYLATRKPNNFRMYLSSLIPEPCRVEPGYKREKKKKRRLEFPTDVSPQTQSRTSNGWVDDIYISIRTTTRGSTQRSEMYLLFMQGEVFSVFPMSADLEWSPSRSFLVLMGFELFWLCSTKCGYRQYGYYGKCTERLAVQCVRELSFWMFLLCRVAWTRRESFLSFMLVSVWRNKNTRGCGVVNMLL